MKREGRGGDGRRREGRRRREGEGRGEEVVEKERECSRRVEQVERSQNCH